MKLRKIMAGIVATAIAASSFAVIADADVVEVKDGTAFLMYSTGIAGCECWADGKDWVSTTTTVDITGNGQYTLTAKAGYMAINDEDGKEALVEGGQGIMFAAVGVTNGETALPGMVITVDSISFDGKEVAMNGKCYTSSDDGKTTRANIRNRWVTALPDDARTTEGTKEAGTIASNATWNVLDDGSAEVWANPWNEMTVTFTVSGLEDNGNGNTSNPDTQAPADTTAPTTGDSTKPNTNTGVEGVAAVAGVALLAAGAVVVAKKRK